MNQDDMWFTLVPWSAPSTQRFHEFLKAKPNNTRRIIAMMSSNEFSCFPRRIGTAWYCEHTVKTNEPGKDMKQAPFLIEPGFMAKCES